MSTHKILVNLLSILIGSLFLVTQVQANPDIDGMSKCMVVCNGDKPCVSGCVTLYTPPETTNNMVQCFEGCGLRADAIVIEKIKACGEGCLGPKS